ncbi:MAG: glycosyltransferase family 39 protein [Methanobrevibacter sp.]|jgi:hypothetical protein|nr:glycosyltransferase family 39 protein [Methanobrevibacter sp.]
MKNSKMFREKEVGLILFFISLIMLLINLMLSVNENTLRYDELFELYLIKSTIPNIIHFTALDVHPPLHYLVVKEFFSLLNCLGINLGNIIPGKIFSTIPTIILMIFSYKYLKKDIGWIASGLFSLSLVIMPQFLFYLTDVRMYNWGMLFVTLTFYMAYKITINPSRKNYIILIIIGALSAYMHYFCLVAIVCIYLMMIFWFALRNNVKEIMKTIFSGFTILILFIPWISVVVKQINYIKGSYWIGTFDSMTALHYLWYLLSSTQTAETTWDLINNSRDSWGAVILLILLSILMINSFKFIFKDNFSKEIIVSKIINENFLVFGGFVLILELVVGLLLSNLVGRPILHVRYLFISFACFWLTVSILISRVYTNKRLFALCLILFFAGGMISNVNSLNGNINNKYFVNDLKSALNNIGPDDLVIDGDLSLTGYRNLFMNHSDENTVIESLDSYWEIPFKNVYFSLHDSSFFDDNNITNKVNKTLNDGNKVFYLSGIKNPVDHFIIMNKLIKSVDRNLTYTFNVPQIPDHLDYFTTFVVEIKK